MVFLKVLVVAVLSTVLASNLQTDQVKTCIKNVLEAYQKVEKCPLEKEMLAVLGADLDVTDPKTKRLTKALLDAYQFKQKVKRCPEVIHTTSGSVIDVAMKRPVKALLSYNYPEHCMGVKKNGEVYIMTGLLEEYKLVPGLNGKVDTVSFESITNPGYYLRHKNWLARLDRVDKTELFRHDATFIIRKNKYFPGYSALESSNYPGFFLRHQNYRLKLHKAAPKTGIVNALFKKDASFLITSVIKSPKIQSRNYPEYYWSLEGSMAKLSKSIETKIHLITPGLTGVEETVSFYVPGKAPAYLLHRDHKMIAESHSTHKLASFYKDTTFILRQDALLPGFVSLESANLPGYFIRHSGYVLYLHKLKNTLLFQKDSSFKIITTPCEKIHPTVAETTLKPKEEIKPKEGIKTIIKPVLSLDEVVKGNIRMFISYNYPAYSISTKTNGEVYMATGVIEEFEIVKGLNGKLGTVSFQSKTKPGYYLRHKNWLARLDLDDGTDAFKDYATFIIRKNKYFPGYSALESSNYPGFFLRHQSGRLKLHKELKKKFWLTYKVDALFKKDASFLITSLVPTAMIQSVARPAYFWHILDTNVLMEKNITAVPIISPGLTGKEGTVSFLIPGKSTRYIHQRNRVIRCEEVPKQRINAFRSDATYKLRKDVWKKRCVSFEMVNRPGTYIRNSGLVLHTMKYDETKEFKDETCFRVNIKKTLV